MASTRHRGRSRPPSRVVHSRTKRRRFEDPGHPRKVEGSREAKEYGRDAGAHVRRAGAAPETVERWIYRRDELGRFAPGKRRKAPARPSRKAPSRPQAKPLKKVRRKGERSEGGRGRGGRPAVPVRGRPPAKPAKKALRRPPAKPAKKVLRRPPAKPAKKVLRRPPAKPAKKLPRRPPATPAKKIVRRPIAKPVRKPARKIPRKPPVIRKKRKPRPRRPLPIVSELSRQADTEMQVKLVWVLEHIESMFPGMDMAIKTFINADGTVDGELRIGNLIPEWQGEDGVGWMIAALSEMFRAFPLFDKKPDMGGKFWISFGVRFGPQNDADLGELAELYKRFRGMFQTGSYPSPADDPVRIQLALVGLKTIMDGVMREHGLSHAVVLIRFIWTFQADKKGRIEQPGRYKDELGDRE